MIAMQGNPFSPDYFRARRAGGGRALDFCSMHVSVYGPSGATAFALEEGPIGEGARSERDLRIGRSGFAWHADRLVITLDERTTPAPRYNPFRRPVRGRVVVRPEAFPSRAFAIDAAGQHLWYPVAPLARIDVQLDAPRVSFSGHGYHDANAGEAALDASFDRWSWSRARAADRALLTYDVRDVAGRETTHALRVDAAGEIERVDHSRRVSLPRSRWGLTRDARLTEPGAAEHVRSLEDGPFYARDLVRTHIEGRPAIAMHETLAAHRLRRRWVRFCTSYRMRQR